MMLNLNKPNKEEIPIKQEGKNDQNNINTENRLENDKTNKNITNNKKEEFSECKEFCMPDCCFCSESCSCKINGFITLLFTIISFSIILFILYCFIPQNHFDGHKIFSFITNIDSDHLAAYYIIFGVETILYIHFVFVILPFCNFRGWESEKCCDMIFSCITMVFCCFCMFCCCCVDGCDSNSLHKNTSKCIKYLYKTAFYCFNIFFIPTIILYFCSDKDIKIEQKRVKWVFYVILSFLIIDIFSFIHVIIYGKKTIWKRNFFFGILGFLVSFFIYKYTFEVYKYLLIPTAYYFVINNLFIYLLSQQWTADFYPLYASVGYLFVFLAIPIIILTIVLVFLYFVKECCKDCCKKTSTQRDEDSNNDKNNTPPIEEPVQEPLDENN